MARPRAATPALRRSKLDALSLLLPLSLLAHVPFGHSVHQDTFYLASIYGTVATPLGLPFILLDTPSRLRDLASRLTTLVSRLSCFVSLALALVSRIRLSTTLLTRLSSRPSDDALHSTLLDLQEFYSSFLSLSLPLILSLSIPHTLDSPRARSGGLFAPSDLAHTECRSITEIANNLTALD